MAALEALSCGLPAIVSKTSGVNEIITNNLNGVVLENNNSMCLSEAINVLLADKRKATKMARAARKLAFRNDWRRISKKYYSLYLESLK